MSMNEEEKKNKAALLYRQLCKNLDDRNWTYEKNEEDMDVIFTVTGEDLPMHYMINVDAERQLIRVISPMPFTFSEDKRMDGALAICIANYGMADGGFDYDVKEGLVTFRLAVCFAGDTVMGDELFNYIVNCPCAMVDFFNDKFMALNKGLIDINKFDELRNLG